MTRSVTFCLTPAVLSKLEALACSLKIDTSQALEHLIDSATCFLEKKENPLQSLSPKQKEVFDCLKAGLSVKEIASKMGVKEDTTRTHIHHARSVLQCPDLLSLRFDVSNGDRPAQQSYSTPNSPTF